MKKELIKDNFYEAVNGKWLETAEIPSDKPSMSAFLELHLDIEKTLMDLTDSWLKDQTNLNYNMKKFIKFYKMTKDFETRTNLGTKPVKPVIDKLNSLNSLKDLEENTKDFLLSSIDTPIGFSVMQDFKDSSTQVLYFGFASLFLPDTSHYENEETKAQLLGLFQATTLQLLTLYGYSQEESLKLLTEAIAFDALLVPITKSSVERADYVKLYNPVSKEEINDVIKNFDLIALAESLVNDKVDEIVFMNLDYLTAFDNVINEENFPLIKSWMLVNNLISFAQYLTDDLRVASGAFQRALSGIQEAQSKEKFAFYQAYNRFSQVVGLHYGENFFGPDAKKDVQEMVFEMIDVYKERIVANDWLQEETKEKAVEKLGTLQVHVGYPDELPAYYDLYEILSYDEGANIVELALQMNKKVYEDIFSKYKKAPNKNLWSMPASMVNAYYSPTNNQIVFPAAILQKPYYSLEQHSSANYGGIGAVIAHEISHAFDNNGAKFDETGSLGNWWTDEDLRIFNEKAQDMITLFDGVETGNGPCNGTLTVSENIADSGGIRAALEASKHSKDHSNDEFFENWARVWRQKSSPEYAQLLLTVDVHGPAILRANMQLSNLIEFQEHYDIKEGDKMYLPKEKMVSIW